MSSLIIAPPSHAIALPAPRIALNIRPGTIGDLAFIDDLQKRHTRMVGFLHRATIEGKVRLGHVLVAEDTSKRPIGYCIGNDQYFKRDDVGIIYQLNVAPGYRRSFVGATLLKAMFDRAAWGCKLFCCWCAQDIEANRFWEAMGFVPLAFRAGSRKRDRVHIFWQRRIRAGDATTPWWFPAQTGGGSIREDRLVLPIPLGTHWSDAKPVVLPGLQEPEARGEGSALTSDSCALDLSGRKPRTRRPKTTMPSKGEKKTAIASGGLRFVAKSDLTATAEAAKLKRSHKHERKPLKNDPRYVAAARELRDRYLEAVNSGGYALPETGKYDVARELGADRPEVLPRAHDLLSAA